MIRFLLALFTGALLGLLSLAGYGYYLVTKPITFPESGITLRIESGASARSIARTLLKNGVIENEELFFLTTRLMGLDAAYKAGKYRFKGSQNLLSVIETLKEGQVLLVSFAIPEGLNQWQISEKLGEAFEGFTAADFAAALSAPELLALLPKEATTVEGYLFPDTYSISEDASVIDALRMMIDAFLAKDNPEWQVLRKDLGMSLHEMVTLASIIEKETGHPSERPRISGVFHNRLRMKMKLQTDPTVIYGIWDRYDGNIRKKDLQTPTPYNTYVIDGLPPGPIASPGADALDAAVRPLPTDELYFVALGDGSGLHKFSKTLTDHNRAVREYLRQLRKSRNR
jgi:UPF0755 protein